MDHRVFHHAVFADFIPLRFKLRFDQGQNPRVIRDERQHSGNNGFERNERNVNNGKQWFFIEVDDAVMSDIRAFDGDHARVFAQFPRQLAVAHIHGKHLPRAGLQETVGETARGSAHIQNGKAIHIQRKMIQRPF